MPVRPLLESTAPLALCARLPTLARMVLQLDPSQLPSIKSEYGQLAQTGIGISLACAAILLLAGLAYAMKTFVQYKRETSED